MTLGISEILEKASKLRKKEDKIKFLRDNNSPSLRLVLQFALHPNVHVLLPEGPAPYQRNDLADENFGMLYSEAKKLYLFCDGGNPNLSQTKREMLFIQMLETIHSKDADLLIAAKDKTLPYKGLNKQIVEEAFPDIFQ